MMQKIFLGAIGCVGIMLLYASFVMGDRVGVLVGCLGCIVVGTAIYIWLDEYYRGQVDEKAAGAAYANKEAFVRAIKDMQHDLKSDVIYLAESHGRTKHELEMAQSKITRMTTRRRGADGLFIANDSASQPRLTVDGETAPHE